MELQFICSEQNDANKTKKNIFKFLKTAHQNL